MQSTKVDFKKPPSFQERLKEYGKDYKDMMGEDMKPMYSDSVSSFDAEVIKIDQTRNLQEKITRIILLLKWNRRGVGKIAADEMKKIIDNPEWAKQYSGDIYLVCAGEEIGTRASTIDKSLNANQRAKNFDFNFLCNLHFLFSPHQHLEYRILCGQYLLAYCSAHMTPEQYDKVNKQMFEFANNDEFKFGERADIADTLSRIADPNVQKLAEALIENLGNPKGDVITIYQHGENVHNDSILKSVYSSLDVLKKDTVPEDQDLRQIIPTIEKLGKVRIDKRKRALRVVKDIPVAKKKDLEKELTDKQAAVSFSLNRISQDRNRFRGLLLVDILRRVFNRIEWGYYDDKQVFHEADTSLKPLLWSRLLDELEDGSGLCASGYAARLVNVLCGFGLDVRVGWEDQIVGNISGAIQKHLRGMNKGEKEDIILGMSDLDDPDIRQKFLDFYDTVETSLYPELLQDYVKGDLLKKKEFVEIYCTALKRVTLIEEDPNEFDSD